MPSYKDLPVPQNISESVGADSATLSELRHAHGLTIVRAAVVQGVVDVAMSFNVNRNMSAEQAARTADRIICKYWYLSLPELKYIFEEAICGAKVYERLDSNIILGWIGDYVAKRIEYHEQCNINENNAYKNEAASGNGLMFYEAYIKRLQERARNGDKHAIEALQKADEAQNAASEIARKEAAFLKFKQEYEQRKRKEQGNNVQ